MHAAVAMLLLTAGTFAGAAQPEEMPADTMIRLERTRCFGECPAYSVTIDAGGNVTFDGKDFVRVTGRRTARVAISTVRALLETARRIGFFDLHDKYRALITDLPTTFVTVTAAGRSKRIEDYVGAPRALHDFEREIDEAARTQQWIRIDAPTLGQLVRDGHPPSASERAEMLRKALLHDDVDVVKDLLQLGADPNGVYYGTNTTPLMMVRSAAAVRALIDAGADPSVRNTNGYSVWYPASYLSPDVAEALLSSGAPVDAGADSDGRTPLWLAACGGNAGVVGILLGGGANAGATAASSGLSALTCAQEGRERTRQHPRQSISDSPPPFVPDYDRTIALLQDALARQKRR